MDDKTQTLPIPPVEINTGKHDIGMVGLLLGAFGAGVAAGAYLVYSAVEEDKKTLPKFGMRFNLSPVPGLHVVE